MATTYRQSPDESRPEYLARIFKGRVYTLDGEVIPSMPEWIIDNEIENDDAYCIAGMSMDWPFEIGGGAFATFTLRRLA